MRYEPATFDELPGWVEDDHPAALSAFSNSFDVLRRAMPYLKAPGRLSARAYFEACFLPHRVVHDHGDGLFTGYYEPVLKGSRVRSEQYSVAILGRPPELETLVDDSLRGSTGEVLTHGLRSENGIEAYATRKEIEQGLLDGRGLELLYLACPVDAYFLHVQGSGLIELDDGQRVRIGYAGKNGHPYTSIGQALIAQGVFRAADVTMQSLYEWLTADVQRGRDLMWCNKSYVFFKKIGDAATVKAVGVENIELTAGRSLAVDASLHRIGLPVFVVIEGLQGDGAGPDFRRLMVAQDVGSAIQGAERGDIYFGTGEAAATLAGTTKHRGQMYVLMPRGGGVG